MAKNLLALLARLPIVYLTTVDSNNSEKKLIVEQLFSAVDTVVFIEWSIQGTETAIEKLHVQVIWSVKQAHFDEHW